MQLKFIALLMGAFILSTNLVIAESKDHPAPTPINKSSQDKLTKENLKIRHHNAIFDDPTAGGMPYTPYEKIPNETQKGK